MRSHEDDLRYLLDETDQHMAVLDSEGRFEWVNRTAAAFFGRRAEDLVGREILEVIHLDERDQARRRIVDWIPRVGRKSLSLDLRLEHAEERYGRWVLVRRDAAQDGFASYVQDVTESTLMTRHLMRSETHLRSVLGGLLDGVVTIDVRGTIQFASESMLPLFGWDPEDLVGRNVNVLMPEPHHSAHDGYLAKYVRTGDTWILNTVREFDVVRRDGSRFPCELAVSRVDVPGEPPVFCGVLRDATARKQVEVQLAASERRFRAVFQQEHQLVLLVDPAGRVVECNRAACALVGIEPEEAPHGTHLQDVPWWPDPAAAVPLVADWMTRTAAGKVVETDVELQDHTTDLRTIRLSFKPVELDPGGAVFRLLEGRDVTQLLKVQRRETNLLRALATIGESAAVLAHEVKNPITSIHVALRAVAHELGQDERQALEDMATRLENLEALLRRTLSFAKPLTLTPVPLAVSDWVEAALETLRPEAEAAGVTLTADIPDDCPLVRADRAHAEELLLNLVRNALDALTGTGGRVRVQAASVRADQVLLHVDDDGPGIPPGMRDQLFQPFATSKEDGTGIGLALCRKVAEEHGASLEAADSPLGGARFSLTWPTLRPSP